MAFKSSKGRDVGKEVRTWQSSEIGQGIGGVGGAAGAPSPIGAGGSITMDEIDYENNVRTIVHVFDSPGNFTLSSAVTNVEYLAVGGGGGGGGGQRPEKGGGGGGAGGTVNAFLPGLGANSYSVTIGTAGTGGAGAPAQGTAYPGTDGYDTVFSGPDITTITMVGGGAGSGGNNGSGNPGGSGGGGGGASRPSGSAPGYPGTSQQGFPGGPGRGTPAWNGGGGGGASKQGTSPGPGGYGIRVDWIPPTYGANSPSSYDYNTNSDNYIIYNQTTLGQHENGGVGISSNRFFGGGGGGGQGAAGGGGQGVGSNVPTTGGGGPGGPGPGGGTGGDGQPGFFAIKVIYDFPT